jgi:hypothetical protein
MSRKQLPATPMIPWQEMSQAQKFDALTVMALDEAGRIFNLPNEPAALEPLGPDPVRVMRAKLEMAQTVMATRVRVDDTALRAEQHENWLELLRAKMEAARAELPAPRQEKEPKL